MTILGWILFGLVVGAVAKLLMPGRDPGGIIVTMLLGVAGAVLGGFVGRLLGWYNAGEPAGFVMALLGAVLLLFIYRQAVKRTACRLSVSDRAVANDGGGLRPANVPSGGSYPCGGT